MGVLFFFFYFNFFKKTLSYFITSHYPIKKMLLLYALQVTRWQRSLNNIVMSILVYYTYHIHFIPILSICSVYRNHFFFFFNILPFRDFLYENYNFFEGKYFHIHAKLKPIPQYCNDVEGARRYNSKDYYLIFQVA